MSYLIRRVALALFIGVCLWPEVARADRIVYAAFTAVLKTGPLAGTEFLVLCSYDADQVSRKGESYVTLDSFDFTLLGAHFTHDNLTQGGQAIFRDGHLENLTGSFQSVMPPNSPVSNITFGFGEDRGIAYIDLHGVYGTGSLMLNVHHPPPRPRATL